METTENYGWLPRLCTAIFDAGISPGLTMPEAEVAEAWRAGMNDTYERHGVERTPLLILREEDVLMSFLTVRRMEESIAAARNEKASEETRAGQPTIAAQIEAAGKARERMRKAVKELEESCARAGTPIAVGIADTVRPLLKRSQGVIEDAVAFEAGKTPESNSPEPEEHTNAN